MNALDAIVQQCFVGDTEHTPVAMLHVLEMAERALAQSHGQALLEVGVRAGQTSAALAMLAAQVSPAFRVIGIDPWGNAPYAMGRQRQDVSCYGDAFYLEAKARLAGHANHLLLPFSSWTALAWLAVLLWHHKGAIYPIKHPYLAFAFLDGVHTDDAVAYELEVLWPLLASGGIILCDDADFYRPTMDQWAAREDCTCILDEWDQIEYPIGRPKRAAFEKKGAA
jgi:SAM-dependent methyltransferase